MCKAVISATFGVAARRAANNNQRYRCGVQITGIFCGDRAVATGFDPYYKWLGIPQADQPPHHYRLLGIELFESDGQVIESAADRQMTYLRTFQAGPHSELSQRLLNELSAARLCLLKPEKKAEYDAWLRGRLLRQASPAVPAAAPPVLMPRMPMPSYTVPPISGPVTPVPGPLASMPVVPGPAYSAPLPKDLGLLQPYAGYRPRRPRNRVLPLVLTALVALGGHGWFLLTFVLSLPAFRSDPRKKRKSNFGPPSPLQKPIPINIPPARTPMPARQRRRQTPAEPRRSATARRAIPRVSLECLERFIPNQLPLCRKRSMIRRPTCCRRPIIDRSAQAHRCPAGCHFRRLDGKQWATRFAVRGRRFA